jgi:hypothetical protein
MTKTQAKQLVVCVENDGYAVSLKKPVGWVSRRRNPPFVADKWRITLSLIRPRASSFQIVALHRGKFRDG